MSTCFGKAELRQALYSAPVIERAQERRRMYQQKTILFVKDVLETLNCTKVLPI